MSCVHVHSLWNHLCGSENYISDKTILSWAYKNDPDFHERRYHLFHRMQYTSTSMEIYRRGWSKRSFTHEKSDYCVWLPRKLEIEKTHVLCSATYSWMSYGLQLKSFLHTAHCSVKCTYKSQSWMKRRRRCSRKIDYFSETALKSQQYLPAVHTSLFLSLSLNWTTCYERNSLKMLWERNKGTWKDDNPIFFDLNGYIHFIFSSSHCLWIVK